MHRHDRKVLAQRAACFRDPLRAVAGRGLGLSAGREAVRLARENPT